MVFNLLKRLEKVKHQKIRGVEGGVVSGCFTGDVLQHLLFKKASFAVEDEPTQLKPSLGRDGSEGWRVVPCLLPRCECVFTMEDMQ